MKKTPSQRHFAYRHPTFGTVKAPKSVSHWQGSVYYWWWAYLRKNADYIACCDAGGEGAMAALYQDFGDVSADDFKAWWSEGSRAIRLFAEPAAEDVVRELTGGEMAPNQEDVLTLVFPLNMPKRYLQKRFNQLLKKHHTGKQGVQYAKKSRARYKFEGQSVIVTELNYIILEFGFCEIKLPKLCFLAVIGQKLGIASET